MALPSPISSRSSSPASSSDEEERQEAKRRKAQFEAAAAQTATNGPEASTSAFVPPKGMKKASDDETLTEFSYEAIKDKLSKGCQLWAVRLPQNLSKLRYLNDIKISLPDHADASTSASSERLAEFQHKKNDYEIYSLTDNTEDVSNIGAGEMRNMTALLANKRKKYKSVHIQRHLVVKQAISFPPETSEKMDALTGYVRHEQPEGLDGFFAPAGFYSNLEEASRKRQRTEQDDYDDAEDELPPPLAASGKEPANETAQDVSMAQSSPSKEEKKRLKKEKKEKKEKKKRKSEVATTEEVEA